jgi:argininosuccinate lyase
LVSYALSAVAGTLSKLANDVCLYASQNFNLLVLPDAFTTGSSIMPHKKNPDVFELIRARCNRIQALPGEIDHIWINLPSGYFRDMQVIKESFLPAFNDLKTCLDIAAHAISELIPVENSLNDPRYRYIFSVEAVNRMVMQGVPFREAYREVAKQITDGTYPDETTVQHVHTGSLGNLCNDRIVRKMEEIWTRFPFPVKDRAIGELLTRKS